MNTSRLIRCAASAAVLALTSLAASAAEVWNLVTAASAPLAAGDVVIIAASGFNFALSTNQKTNNRDQASITKDSANGTCVPSADVQTLTICAGSSSGTFAFDTGAGYLYAPSTSSNYLKTQKTLDAKASWKISFDGSVASIVSSDTAVHGIMQYNSGSALFSCYDKASQKAVCIYRRTIVATDPEISVTPTAATITFGETVTATLTLNDLVESVSASHGTVAGTSFSWTPDAVGATTVTFTASGADSTATATLDVTVLPASLSTAPTLSAIDTATLLADGTGFSLDWSAIDTATGYEIQVATGEDFDRASSILATETFATLTASSVPSGWTSSLGSDLAYSNQAYCVEIPAYKFKNDGQGLTSPVFGDGVTKVCFASYGYKSDKGLSSLVVAGKINGAITESHSVDIVQNKRNEYAVGFDTPVDQVAFTLNKIGSNVSFDDATFYGAYEDTVVQTLTPSGADTTTADVTDLSPNTLYYIRVRATTDSSVSDWSNTVSIQTPTGTTPFPPELSVTPVTASIAGGESVPFRIVYSDANEEDALSLSVSIDNGEPVPLDLASGSTYDYTPTTAGDHTLVFSVSDGTFTVPATCTVSVSLAAPAALEATDTTTAPWGFTASWSPVALAESYEVEVATDPLFANALGPIVLTEDFATLTGTDTPTAWTASANGGGGVSSLAFTGSASCGALAPAFRFAKDGETLRTPAFAPARSVEFFGYSSAGTASLTLYGYREGSHVDTASLAIAEGRGTYACEFSTDVTEIVFEFGKDSGTLGLDDIVIRTTSALDARVWTVTQDAASTAADVTGLANAPAYYARVRAIGGGIASGWSPTATVEFLRAPENIGFVHGKYLESGFTVQWDEAVGADSYRVDVREARLVPHTTALAEDFSSGKTAPAGWTYHDIGEYTSTTSSGDAPKSLQFKTASTAGKTGSYIESPRFGNPVDGLSFWAKAASASAGCQLTVSALAGFEWLTIGRVEPPSVSGGTTYEMDLPGNTRAVRLELTAKNGTSNLALDDLVVTGIAQVFFDYGSYETDATSLALDALRPGRDYKFTVSSVNESGEVPAVPVTTATPPANPATLLRIR